MLGLGLCPRHPQTLRSPEGHVYEVMFSGSSAKASTSARSHSGWHLLLKQEANSKPLCSNIWLPCLEEQGCLRGKTGGGIPDFHARLLALVHKKRSRAVSILAAVLEVPARAVIEQGHQAPWAETQAAQSARRRIAVSVFALCFLKVCASSRRVCFMGRGRRGLVRV